MTDSPVMEDLEKIQNSHEPDGRDSHDRTSELMATNRKLRKAVKAAILEKEQSRQSEKLVNMVFEGTKDPLIILTPDMKIKMHNSAAIEHFGICETDDIVSHYCYQLFCGQSGPCESCPALDAVASGKTIIVEQKNDRNPEKMDMYTAYPLKNSDSELEGIVIRITDITEKKLFENQLTQSDKLASLGILITSIAHEINNPNNFISLNIPVLRDYLKEMMPIIDIHSKRQPNLEMLNMPYPDFRKDVFNLLDNMDHGAERISKIVSALKGFSRVNGPRAQKWIDLASVIERTLAICGSKIKKSAKSFIKCVPPNLPKIYTDPDYLEQILINLLINAADACQGRNSFVRLGVEVRNSWLNHTIIEVTDNGCGMDPETMEKIFDPFFTTKVRAQDQGTGLGLYISRNLIESLGGRIQVESRPGSGSTFRVILPDKERRKRMRE